MLAQVPNCSEFRLPAEVLPRSARVLGVQHRTYSTYSTRDDNLPVLAAERQAS